MNLKIPSPRIYSLKKNEGEAVWQFENENVNQIFTQDKWENKKMPPKKREMEINSTHFNCIDKFNMKRDDDRCETSQIYLKVLLYLIMTREIVGQCNQKKNHNEWK